MTVSRLVLCVLVLSGPGCKPAAFEALWNTARTADRPPPAPRPIPSAPATPTRRADEKARLDWARRNLLEAYDRVGSRDPRWDAPARQFIEMSLAPLSAAWSETPLEVRIARGKAVLELGCGDPLVGYLHASDLFEADADSYEALSQYKRSVQGMRLVPYPRAVARYVISGYHRDLQQLRQVGTGFWPMAPTELQWFRESLSDGSYQPGEETVLIWQLMNGTGHDFVARNSVEVSAALDGAAWIPPWVRLHFSGLKEHHLAWEARGYGFAKDVTPAQWKTFEEHSAPARRDLVQAWELRPDRPEAAYEMISTSGDAPDPGADARTWFDRAVAAQMDYWPAYSTRLVHLLPRWGGSYAEMLAFAAECVQTQRFDTDVPLFALEIVEAADRDQRDGEAGAGGEPVYELPATFELLSRMLDGYLKEPSRSTERARFESLYVVVAEKARRHDVALQHLKANGFELDGDARRRLAQPWQDFVGKVALSAGPAAPEAERAEAHRQAYQTAQAIASLGEALRKDASPASARLLKHRLAALDVERRLERGETVAFLPSDAQLAGWERRLGSFEAKDGTLSVTPGGRGHLITSAARVGPDFELRGSVEFLADTSQAGVAFGHPDWDALDWVGFCVLRTREKQVAYLTHQVWQGVVGPLPIPNLEHMRFVVRSWRGRLSAAFNGQIVFKDQPAPEGFVEDRDAQVGLGAYSRDGQPVHYREVQLRRLTSEPPPLQVN